MRTIRLETGRPILDIISYGRAGPSARLALTPAQIAQIHRTVSRAPEVVVKVTGGGGSTTGRGVVAHFSYFGRRGDLEIDTDDGQHLIGRGVGWHLLDDWDLDLEEDRKRLDLFATNRRKPPKLVHRLIFSMPAGTPPQKVLAAVRDFAREEFGLKHRYAMVLHTDEPHPHVHIVVKALNEDGERINIRKATLRHWRQEFARQRMGNCAESSARSGGWHQLADDVARFVNRMPPACTEKERLADELMTLARQQRVRDRPPIR